MKEIISSILLLFSAVSIHCTSADGRGSDVNQGVFRCTESGYFPVPGSCDEYYECQRWERGLRLFRSVCPSGKIFDDVYAECRPEAYVTSPAVCADNVHADLAVVSDTDGTEEAVLSNQPSATVETHLADVTAETVSDNVTSDVEVNHVVTGGNATGNNTDVLEELSGVVEDVNVTLSNVTIDVNATEATVAVEQLTTCDHMTIVDSYATLVISSQSLHESFEHEEQFNSNVMKYNRGLEIAKNNTQIWRSSDSILTLIKKAYAQAAIFEEEFNRKYEINQERLQSLSSQKNNDAFVQTLKEDINKLKEEIKAVEQVLEMTAVPSLKQYFEADIASKRQEIRRKQQEIKTNSKVALELEELLQFLEFVKEDAREVENLSKDAQDRLLILYGSLVGDSDNFEKYLALANEGIHALSGERESHEENLSFNAAEQQRLERQKDDIDAEIDNLNDANNNNLQEIRRLTDEMERKTNVFNRKKNILCNKDNPVIRVLIEANKTRTTLIEACNTILRKENVFLDLSEERAKTQQLTEASERNRGTIINILSGLQGLDQQISDLYNALPSYKSRLLQIDSELGRLRMYYTDLENLQSGINSAINSLLEITKVFQELQSSFESLSKQFDIVIAQGKTAVKDEDKQQVKTSITELISNVQGQLGVLQIPQMRNCT